MPPRIEPARDLRSRTPSIPGIRRWLLGFTAAFVALYGQVPAQVASINLSRDLVTPSASPPATR